MRLRRLTPGLLALPAALALLAGCASQAPKEDESKLTVVKGGLVENGKPFALDESKVPLPPGAHGLPPGLTNSGLQVVFSSTDGARTYVATTNPKAGTFEVPGENGKGIPVGRYKISVTGSMGMGPGMPDYFKGKFSPEKTKILRDVKDGEAVTIDVAKADG